MDPNCDICRMSKIQKAHHQKSSNKADRYDKEPINEFGELTADHAIMSHDHECIDRLAAIARACISRSLVTCWSFN